MNEKSSLIPPLVSRVQKAIFLIWVLSLVLVLYGSLSPDMHLDIRMQDSDKVLHSLAYTWMALGGRMSFVPASRSAGLTICLICLGCAVEIAQGFVPGRFFSLADMGANALGVGLGLFFAHLIARWGPRFLASIIK
ncbi:MAG: VanZ family protein [Desulfovermiculus sp.]|nr:VanZ family protein [Desulfovermiculus sp.]